MEPAERALFRKLRIKVRRRVDALFAGEYHSAFRGYGLLFDGVREYLYGDDVRNIDWNVSARANHLYVRNTSRNASFPSCWPSTCRPRSTTEPPAASVAF